MAVRPTTHFEWQVLRTVKRSKKPSIGRALRLAYTRNTKDGSFLTLMVQRDLLIRVTGTEEAPFEATYTLSEKGKHAAEYGEYEYEFRRKPIDTATQETTNTGTNKARSRG